MTSQGPSAPSPSPSPAPNTDPHFSFSHLSVWARAGLVIASILILIFIFSTTVLCILRRGRLFTRSRRSKRAASVPKREYRKPDHGFASKGFASTTTTEVYDEESGSRYESPDTPALAVGVEARVLKQPEEVALQEYGHGYGYGYGYGQEHGHGYGYDKVQMDSDGYQRHEREQRPWNVV